MGVTVLGLVKVATRPARSVPPWQGLIGLLAGRGASGGARQGGGRLPDEAAQSAGSEPFEVRVPPEGCPVAGRPGAGAVRLPRARGNSWVVVYPNISASPLTAALA